MTTSVSVMSRQTVVTLAAQPLMLFSARYENVINAVTLRPAPRRRSERLLPWKPALPVIRARILAAGFCHRHVRSRVYLQILMPAPPATGEGQPDRAHKHLEVQREARLSHVKQVVAKSEPWGAVSRAVDLRRSGQAGTDLDPQIKPRILQNALSVHVYGQWPRSDQRHLTLP